MAKYDNQKASISFREEVRRHFRIPFYIPVEQVYRYLERNGTISSELRNEYDNISRQEEMKYGRGI